LSLLDQKAFDWNDASRPVLVLILPRPRPMVVEYGDEDEDDYEDGG
jgi:hypothetical protein